VLLLSELVGALGAGALVILVARQVGAESRHAFGAVALVPMVVAAVLAVPSLRNDAADLLHQREVNSPISDEEARLEPGVAAGMNVGFLAWAREHMAADDTFHMVVGPAPDETYLQGVGIREGLVLQWGLFQLAPHLEVEAEDADWIVFYETSPADYPPRKLGEVIAYAPDFAIARNEVAG
jgi:hypothetical protein